MGWLNSISYYAGLPSHSSFKEFHTWEFCVRMERYWKAARDMNKKKTELPQWVITTGEVQILQKSIFADVKHAWVKVQNNIQHAATCTLFGNLQLLIYNH